MFKEIIYDAQEFQVNGKFDLKKYKIKKENEKWQLFRENELILSLPLDQYTVLKVLFCGICSTDLAIVNYPFGVGKKKDLKNETNFD